jgi:glycosyltransferase involved in cell wall biosynthesis
MEILVSIVVPCYKQAHYLEETLQSVLEQSYSNWECIVVDDGSPDHTAQVAEQWCKKDKRFKYLYQKNLGLPSARNSGIRISKGEYILPLDSDDILHKDYLKKTVVILDLEKHVGVVSCYRYFFVNNVNNIIKEFKASGSNYHDLMFENKLMPSSIFRKKCWEEVGGYDESMTKGYEDWEFWLSVTKKKWEFKFVEEFLFFYRKSSNSMLVDTTKNHSESVRKYIFIKHKDLYIEDFENCMEVLFYEINTHRVNKMKLKNSIEYKIGKVFTKPFRWFTKLVSKNK